jgi:hypothetical protein
LTLFRNQNPLDWRITDLCVLALVALLFAGPYFVFPAGWFGDDGTLLQFAQRNIHSRASDLFLYKDSEMDRYRPLMQTLAVFSYRYFGLNTALIRVASYLAFLTTLATLYALLRGMTDLRWAPLFSLVWFAAVPVKTQALFRPGRPEIFVTAFCLLSIFCLQNGQRPVSRSDDVRNRYAWLAGSILFALGAALWSEIGISVFLVMALWIIAPCFIDRPGIDTNSKPPLHATIKWLFLPLAGVVIYLTWYRFVGAPLSSSGRYQPHLGWEVLSNVLVAFSGLVSPISSPVLARIVHRSAGIQDWLCVVSGLISLAVLGVLLTVSVGRERRSLQIAALFLGSSMVSLVPFVFVGHVSEVYLAQAAAFMSGCAGVLTGSAFDKMYRLKSGLFSVTLMALLCVMVFSSLAAFLLLRNNAKVFATLYGELLRRRQIDGVESLLLVPPRTSFEYSQYYLPYDKLLYFEYANMPKFKWLSDWRAIPDVSSEPSAVYQVDVDGRMTPYSPR